MTPCPSDFFLDAVSVHSLEPDARRAFEQHLGECPRCYDRRQLLVDQRRTFLGHREHRPPHGTHRTRRKSRPRPLMAAVMMALGVLWFALWWTRDLRASGAPSAVPTLERPTR
jgi:anti-sigma factor RsiW